jgi:hypothetical protein
LEEASFAASVWDASTTRPMRSYRLAPYLARIAGLV